MDETGVLGLLEELSILLEDSKPVFGKNNLRQVDIAAAFDIMDEIRDLLSLIHISTPKRCCSSMTARVRFRGTTSSESSAWVPMSASTSPAAKPSTMAARSTAAVEPVSRATRTPAPSKRSPRPSMCWRASTSVGAVSYTHLDVYKRQR